MEEEDGQTLSSSTPLLNTSTVTGVTDGALPEGGREVAADAASPPVTAPPVQPHRQVNAGAGDWVLGRVFTPSIGVV